MEETQPEPQSNAEIKCPECQSIDIIRKGNRITKKGEVQTYRCKKCNRKFAEHDRFSRQKANHSVISESIKLKSKGLSYDKIRNKLFEKYKVYVARSTIQRWVEGTKKGKEKPRVTVAEPKKKEKKPEQKQTSNENEDDAEGIQKELNKMYILNGILKGRIPDDYKFDLIQEKIEELADESLIDEDALMILGIVIDNYAESNKDIAIKILSEWLESKIELTEECIVSWDNMRKKEE